MNTQTLTCAVLALASTFWPANMRAQTAYRCGNAYSQEPCPGGTAIDVSDVRTPQQKAQTDAAAKQAAAIALRMEKERIALERIRPAAGDKKPVHARPVPGQSKADTREDSAAATRKRKGKNAPEYFTAAAQDDKPQDKASVKPGSPVPKP